MRLGKSRTTGSTGGDWKRSHGEECGAPATAPRRGRTLLSQGADGASATGPGVRSGAPDRPGLPANRDRRGSEADYAALLPISTWTLY